MSAALDSFSHIVQGRHSTRAFLPDAVDSSVLQQIVQSARQAPSGANLQPGSFIQVQGAARARLSADLVASFRAGTQEVDD
ncbi:MAG: nitroreductase family protein, partial [Rhodoferax sp.]|nr:nitroreductase family protein [Rhodoferax sp.]